MGRDDTWQEWENIGDNRPPIYDDGEIRVVRASSVGGCLRSLAAWGQGVDGNQENVPVAMRRAWAEGHRNEPIILNLLRTRELGVKDRMGQETFEEWRPLDAYDVEMQGYATFEDTGQAKGQGRVVVPFHSLTPKVEIRAALDGVSRVFKSKVGKGLDKGTVAVVEAKAFSEATFQKWWKHGLEPFPYYQWQVSVQAHGTGLPVLFVVGVKDDEGVVQDIVTDFYPEPPMSLGALKARVMKLGKLIDKGDLDFQCDYRMFPCPHYFLHDDEEENGKAVKVRKKTEEIPDVGTLQLIAKRFAEAKAEQKRYREKVEKEVKKGEGIIKQWLLDHPEMEGEEVMVPVGDGEVVKMKFEVSGVKEVVHEAEPERVIEAREAWVEEIHHPATEREVIPAKEAWVEKVGTRRVSITAELEEGF